MKLQPPRQPLMQLWLLLQMRALLTRRLAVGNNKNIASFHASYRLKIQ